MGMFGINAFTILNEPTEVSGNGLPLGTVKGLGSRAKFRRVVLINDKITAALCGVLMINGAVYNKHTERFNGIPRKIHVDSANYVVTLFNGSFGLLAHYLSAVVGRIHVLIRRHDRNIGIGHVYFKNICLILILTGGIIKNIISLCGTGGYRIRLLRDHTKVIRRFGRLNIRAVCRSCVFSQSIYR